jgi:hypothetical protein
MVAQFLHIGCRGAIGRLSYLLDVLEKRPFRRSQFSLIELAL